MCEDESCDIIKCMKRHPKKCRYWANFGRCKFGTFCSYKHTDNAHEELRKSFRNLQNNFLQLKTDYEKLVQEVNEMKLNIDKSSMKNSSPIELVLADKIDSSIYDTDTSPMPQLARPT